MSEIYKFRARGVEYGSGVTDGERCELLARRAGAISTAVLSTAVGDSSLSDTRTLLAARKARAGGAGCCALALSASAGSG